MRDFGLGGAPPRSLTRSLRLQLVLVALAGVTVAVAGGAVVAAVSAILRASTAALRVAAALAATSAAPLLPGRRLVLGVPLPSVRLLGSFIVHETVLHRPRPRPRPLVRGGVSVSSRVDDLWPLRRRILYASSGLLAGYRRWTKRPLRWNAFVCRRRPDRPPQPAKRCALLYVEVALSTVKPQHLRRHPSAVGVAPVLDLIADLVALRGHQRGPHPVRRCSLLAIQVVNRSAVLFAQTFHDGLEPTILALAPVLHLASDFEAAGKGRRRRGARCRRDGGNLGLPKSVRQHARLDIEVAGPFVLVQSQHLRRHPATAGRAPILNLLANLELVHGGGARTVRGRPVLATGLACGCASRGRRRQHGFWCCGKSDDFERRQGWWRVLWCVFVPNPGGVCLRFRRQVVGNDGASRPAVHPLHTSADPLGVGRAVVLHALPGFEAFPGFSFMAYHKQRQRLRRRRRGLRRCCHLRCHDRSCAALRRRGLQSSC
mmetsp:Transcript_85/g.300  ORF Transcript_85/g.300 Transcript_85/m.300 type:complete len:487 (+) Transcript_85:580-2040(+)